MSLFGTSPTEAPLPTSRNLSKSLFSDEPTPGTASTSSLFADDNGSDASPWSMPTPKKAARRELVKTLLPVTDVPESYVDAYDNVLDSGQRVGSGVAMTGVKRVLGTSGLNAADQAAILNLIVPTGQENANGMGRSEFNVLLALVGLAQEGEDISLDGVDDRKKNLPEPSISYFDQLNSQHRTPPQPEPSTPQRPSTPPPEPAKSASTPKPQHSRSDSLGNPEVDPWASPAPRYPANENAPKTNGVPAIHSAPNGPPRTTSTFTTRSESPTTNSTEPSSSTPGVGGWGAYNGNQGDFSNPDQSGLGGGFGQSGDDQGNSSQNNMRRSLGSGVVTGRGVEEIINITMLPEKEGMFMFQHRNYEVRSARRASTVVRRYSDFVWLLDCLHKRYPFRQLPLLPPKRVAVNGTHLAADSITFLEKRRRGLVRFANALVRHPTLNQEQLVVMFLTVPTELAVWRKQATISVQEEFTGKPLPPNLEDSLPTNLGETFDTVRAGVRRSADIYINLCTLLERLVKRNQGLAADHLRFSLALQSLTENSEPTYAIDTNDVPLLNEGINATAKHMSTAQSLLEDEARAWDEGVLEDLKRQRDCLVSMRDVFDRRDRYARDNIPQLERRIEANENKLQSLKGRPEGNVKPGEIERVEDQIIRDKESIVVQHARGVFIKECIRDELITFQSSLFHVSKTHQDWSGERVKYAELMADCWRRLVEEVEGMPLGE